MTHAQFALDAHSVGARALAARTPIIIALAFLALHIVLAATVDARDPDVFLRADRAVERIEVIRGLLELDQRGDIADYLGAHGIVGDYAVHAALAALGGRLSVVLAQVGLTILSSLALYRLAGLIGLSRMQSAIAMIVYLSLPHTLVFPHQLVTEALHAPLLVISTWMLAEGLVHRRFAMLLASAVLLGAATLIRPITLLWPLFVTGALLLARRPRDSVLYCCIAYAPVLAWMLFVGAQTGRIGLGESSHSMGRNLYNRVARIVDTMPRATRDAARAEHLPATQRTLGPVAYLRFAAAHPAPVLVHTLRDAVAFFGKSGVERITLDYLKLTPAARVVQNETQGWRRRLESDGPVATLSFLWKHIGALLLVSIAGSAVMLAIVVLAVRGSGLYLRAWRQSHGLDALLGLLLAVAVVYTFVFSLVLNATQSRQRAPVEFALILLATAGAAAWRRRTRRPPLRRPNQA